MNSLRLRSVGVLALVAALLVGYHPISHSRFTRATKTEAPPVAASSKSTRPADAVVCGPMVPGSAFAEAVVNKARSEEALAAMNAFADWLTAWRRAGSDVQPALAASGRDLALARRAALRYFIESDPKRALESAVPIGFRAELPREIQEQLEQPIDARGALEVSIMHIGAEARIERVAQIGDTAYRAFVFGRRENQQTKIGLPLHGIAVDDALALDEHPYRLLDDAEKLSRGLEPDQIAMRIGATTTIVPNAAEFAQLAQTLIAAESAQGPQVLRAFAGSGTIDSHSTPATAAVTSPTSWINGAKRALWIKIDFADDPGAAYTDAEIQASAASINDYYLANSQGKTSFTFSILPVVLRMPKDKAYYNTSGSTSNELYVAAHDAAKTYDAANGNSGAWDPDKFDRYLILHKRMAVYLYGGVAQLGGPRIGLNNAVGAGTATHELGHTQSLAHSHFWLPSGTSPVGAGSHVEYGDTYDIMGGGGINSHFNVSQKYKLGYLDNTSVTTVAQSGVYRINRHDDKDAAGFRALKIAPADLGYEYWVEHRRTAAASLNAAQLDRLRNGVLLHWGTEHAPKFTSGGGTYLLDGTPGSAGGANDAPVRVGETFVDPDAGITIKPLAVGGAAPNEYIDVQVSFGAIDGNRNPTLQAEAPAGQLAARTNIVFNASGSDPDGDSVYFRWDFGDGSLQPNLNSITRRFAKGGDYSLRVSAHDGKGGIAIKNITLRIADPLVSWTQRATGVTTSALSDVIYAGSKFVAVGSAQTILTSPDGITWTRNTTLPSGSNLTGIAYNGARYVACGYRSSGTQRGLAAYSDDGNTWTAVSIDSGTAQFWGIAYGAGRFVAVGDAGAIYTSVNGSTWTAAASSVTNVLRAVTFADNLFVITGDSGRLFTSTDGLTWVNRSLATTSSFWGSTKHNGLWHTRSGSTIYTSPDAVTWTRVSSSNATNLGAYKTQSIAGLLFTGLTAGTMDFGENAQTWASTKLSTLSTAGWRGVAASASTIVAVGNNGLVYSTDVPTASPPPLPAPSLRLEADSIKVAAGKKNVLSATGAGFVKLELYANGTKVSEIDGSSGALSWTPASIGNYVLTVRGVDASGAGVSSAPYAAVAAFAHWKWRNPTPAGAELRGAVRVDNKWWIVGGGGTLLTLDDAGNFVPVDFSTTQQLNAIAYANGRFVIATTDIDGATKEDIGGLWTSVDGYSWTPFLTGALDSANLNYALYAADRWLGFGTGGTIVGSADGLAWPRTASGITNSIQSATSGNGLIVAVCAGGKIITSADGLTWTERTSGVTTDLRAVTYANGTFVAAGLSGVILTSTNGTAWTRTTSGATTNLYGAAFVKGAFVVAGDTGTVLTSTNGTTWTAASLDGKFSNFFFVAGSGEEGLLVGRGGEVYAATTAATWRRLTQGTGEAKQGVAYANGRFVAVGASTDPITRGAVMPVQYSADGINWTRAAANSAFTNLNAITFGQNLFVAVGPTSGIFTSPDGVTWTQRTLNISATLVAVTSGASGFVAPSSGQAIYFSPDGISWSQRLNSAGVALRGAAYGNGRYVVVGDGGNIRTSTDGIAWTSTASGVTANLLTVAWWDDVGFIAAGANGTMINSSDGVTWQLRETGVADNIAALAKTPVGFVAAGGTQGTLLVSLDGISWSLSGLPADKTVRGLAASSSAIVAVGDSGAMLTFELIDTTPAPVIVAQPVSRPGTAGAAATFSVTAQNAAGAVYQWMKDGVPVLGANAPVFTIPIASAAHAGDYTVSITTPTGKVTSSAATLSFGANANPGRLVNLSILTSLTGAADDFTFGVVVGGAATSGGKALLVRAAGPSLTALGVGDVLADPKVEFFTGSTKVGENDNWDGVASTAAVMAQVGAFPFTGPASRDAAISLPSLASGANSAKISGTGSGTVIAELYDATPSNAFTASTPRMINVSVLKYIGSGVTAGFVLGGSTARTVLVRAIGPTLGSFGVGGVVSDPQLALFQGQTQIRANDNWGGASALSAAFTQVGAFALAADAKDAALLATLEPGSYTVQVSGVGGVTGVALIEIYEVPE